MSRAQGLTSWYIHLKSKLLVGNWDLFNLQWLSQFQLVPFRCHLASGERSNLLIPVTMRLRHGLFPDSIRMLRFFCRSLSLICCPVGSFCRRVWPEYLLDYKHFWHNTVVNLKFLWTMNMLFAVVGCTGVVLPLFFATFCPRSCKLVKLILDIDIVFRYV